MKNTASSIRVRGLIWGALGVAITVGLGLLFFFHLSAKPMHNDEAVNAWFFEKLLKENYYRYDPQNYHGPSLYYIQLVVTWIYTFLLDPLHFSLHSTAGITPTSIRLGVAIAGVLILAGVLGAHRRIGRWGAASAALLLAFSSSYVFYSRYFIHEIYLVLFTLGIYLGAIYIRDKKQPFYFYLTCLAVALAYATKETSILIFAVLVLAVLSAEITSYALRGFKRPTPLHNIQRQAAVLCFRLHYRWIIGIGAALIAWALLYSSFFTNPSGLMDSIRTYAAWTKTSVDSGHEKRFWYFFDALLLPFETPILFLAIVGAGAAFLTKRKRGLFLFFWSAGIFFVHSLIPYKTPWLVLNFLLPMALLGGFGINVLVERAGAPQPPVAAKRTAIAVFAISGLLLIYQFFTTIWISFVDYDNEFYPQVYVHTSRDVYRLVDDIDAIAKKTGLDKDMEINIVSTLEWPLPFYLRHYPRAYYWRRYDNLSNLATPLIIAEKSQHAGVAERLTSVPYVTRTYVLRSAAPIELWIRKDIADE